MTSPKDLGNYERSLADATAALKKVGLGMYVTAIKYPPSGGLEGVLRETRKAISYAIKEPGISEARLVDLYRAHNRVADLWSRLDD